MHNIYSCVDSVSLCVKFHIMFALVAAASDIKRVTIQLSLKDEQFSETLRDKTSDAHKTLKRTVVGAVRVVVQYISIFWCQPKHNKYYIVKDVFFLCTYMRYVHIMKPD